MNMLHEFDQDPWDHIIHKQVYFDAINIRLHHKSMHSGWSIHELEQTGAGHVVLLDSPMYRLMQNGLTNDVLDIKQPTHESLRYLEQRLSGKDLVNRAEITVDWIFDHRWQAKDLQVFLVQSLIQADNDQLVWVENDETVYYKREWVNGQLSDRNLAIYSSRPARFYHGAPCTHLELRYTTPSSLQRQGIRSVQDLIDFDFRSFFAKELTLFDISNEDVLNQLAARIIRKGKVKRPWWHVIYNLPGGRFLGLDFRPRYRRRMMALAMIELYGEPVISAHNLKVEINKWGGHVGQDVNEEGMDSPVGHSTKSIDRKPRKTKKRFFEASEFDKISNAPLLSKLDNVLAEGRPSGL